MKYKILRTDTADAGIRKIILYIADKFGKEVAMAKLAEMEKALQILESNPYIGTEPRYLVLKRQGFRLLTLEKDLAFYKVNEATQEVVIYAVVDQRQDYVSIIMGR